MNYTTEEKMKAEIQSSEKTMVIFSADWCGPCKAMNPLLEEAKTQSSRIMKVNVDENRDLVSKMGIRSIPTTVIFQNGSAVDKKVGAMKSVKEICSLLV